MTVRLVCEVPITPRSKQRARSGGDHFYTPEETRTTEELIRAWWNQEIYAAWKQYVPLRLVVTAAFQPPKRPRFKFPVVVPDASNVLKLVEDALNGGVGYHDDSQIVDTRCIKRYCTEGESPHILIELEEVEP